MDAKVQREPSKRKSVTLIPLNWQNYEKRRQFMRSASEFFGEGWKAQVRFADPRYTDAGVCGRDVASIIQKSRSDVVAIIDDDFDFDRKLFCWLAKSIADSEIQCAFQRQRAAKSSTNLFLLLYSLLIRVLFRIGKTVYRPGFVVFHRSEKAVNWIPSTDHFNLTEFLTLARLDSAVVHETLISPRSQPVEPIRSWAVVHEMGQAIRFWWNRILFPGVDSVASSDDRPSLPVPSISWSRQTLGWITLVAASLIVLSVNLGFPLMEPYETTNIREAFNILNSDDWYFSTLGGASNMDRAPIGAWATAFSLHQFGHTEFAARLPANMAAILTILFSVALGRRLIGFPAALAGGFLLLTSIGFVYSARQINTDAAFTLVSTVGLLTSYLAVMRDKFALKWWLFAASACAIGILIKGPVALLIVLPPLFIASWLVGNKQLFTVGIWIWFALPIVAIIGPWVVMIAWMNPGYWTHLVWEQHFDGLFTSLFHPQPWWYFLPIIAFGLFPASMLLPALIKYATDRHPEARRRRSTEIGFLLICSIWIVSLSSLSPSKSPADILPATPFLCLALGWMIGSVVLDSESRWSFAWLRRAPKQIGLTLIATVIVIQLALVWYFDHQEYALFYSVVIPAGLLVIARLSFRSKSSPRVAWSGLAVVAIVFSIYAVDRLSPATIHSRSVYHATDVLREDPALQAANVVFFGEESYGAMLQSEIDNLVSFTPNQLHDACDYIDQRPRTIIIAPNDVMTKLGQALDRSVELQASQHPYVYTSQVTERVSQTDQNVVNR